SERSRLFEIGHRLLDAPGAPPRVPAGYVGELTLRIPSDHARPQGVAVLPYLDLSKRADEEEQGEESARRNDDGLERWPGRHQSFESHAGRAHEPHGARIGVE